jgi:hypothetical protein
VIQEKCDCLQLTLLTRQVQARVSILSSSERSEMRRRDAWCLYLVRGINVNTKHGLQDERSHSPVRLAASPMKKVAPFLKRIKLQEIQCHLVEIIVGFVTNQMQRRFAILRYLINFLEERSDGARTLLSPSNSSLMPSSVTRYATKAMCP